MSTARENGRRPSPRTATRAALAVLALLLAAPLPAAALDALFVVREIPLGDGDEIVDLQLRLRGWNVTLIDDDVVVVGDATGMDLVLVSGTVSSTKVGNTFTTLATPVVTWESFIFDDMGMTGGTSNVDLGTTTNQTDLDIVGGNPLSANLSAGTILMSQRLERITWGVPNGNAIVGAYEAGSLTRAAVFGYDTGVAMVTGNAPARRVGLFLGDFVAREWTADAVDLFEHAISWAVDEPPPTLARVMFLGDSITAGIVSQDSFRVPLWGLFAADNCQLDFVGSYYGKDPVQNDYDAHHESESGLRTDEIMAQLPGNLASNTPDYVAIHLGTNDVLQGFSVTDAKENLRTIIGQLRAVNPFVEIFLAKIIPAPPAFDANAILLNGHIDDLAGEEDQPGSPITLVDHYNRFDPSALVRNDKIHPNDDGEIEMANRWFAVMHPQLSSFCGGSSEEPPPDPPPAPEVPSMSSFGLALTAWLLGTTGLRASRRRRDG